MGSLDDVNECKKYYDKEAAKNPELKARCDERMAPKLQVVAKTK
jgi:hypothetical protein